MSDPFEDALKTAADQVRAQNERLGRERGAKVESEKQKNAELTAAIAAWDAHLIPTISSAIARANELMADTGIEIIATAPQSLPQVQGPLANPARFLTVVNKFDTRTVPINSRPGSQRGRQKARAIGQSAPVATEITFNVNVPRLEFQLDEARVNARFVNYKKAPESTFSVPVQQADPTSIKRIITEFVTLGLVGGAPIPSAAPDRTIEAQEISETSPAPPAEQTSVDFGVNRAGSGGGSTDIITTVEHRLAENPTEIREAARMLSKAIEEQIAELNASKPNEENRLAQQEEFIVFLREIADGLDDLAESIDRAIATGSAQKPEPVLLGKAGEIARALSDVVLDGLERNKAYIVDCTIKISVFAAGFAMLHAIGVDGYIAGVVAALMNLKLPKTG